MIVSCRIECVLVWSYFMHITVALCICSKPVMVMVVVVLCIFRSVLVLSIVSQQESIALW